MGPITPIRIALIRIAKESRSASMKYIFIDDISKTTNKRRRHRNPMSAQTTSPLNTNSEHQPTPYMQPPFLALIVKNLPTIHASRTGIHNSIIVLFSLLASTDRRIEKPLRGPRINTRSTLLRLQTLPITHPIRTTPPRALTHSLHLFLGMLMHFLRIRPQIQR